MSKLRLGPILFVVAIIVWGGLVRAQIKSFTAKALQVQARQVELNSYKQRVEDVNSTKSNGEAIQSTLKALYIAMPRSSQVPEVLVMIETLGHNTGVIFGTASVGTPSGSEVPVSVSFSGSPETVNKFLDALENNIRTITVKNQAVTSDSAGNLTVALQLGLIYQGGE